jgi:hypothetical protein
MSPEEGGLPQTLRLCSGQILRVHREDGAIKRLRSVFEAAGNTQHPAKKVVMTMGVSHMEKINLW